MENTAIFVLHADTDQRGNLYKNAKEKLEEIAEILRPLVNSDTRWLYDGSSVAASTILCLAAQFGLPVTREELAGEAAAPVSNAGEGGKKPAITWVPGFASETIQGPYRFELEQARDILFAHLAEGSVLTCLSERFFRALFEFLGQVPYQGKLAKGDAIQLLFSEQKTPEEGRPAEGNTQTASPAPAEIGQQGKKCPVLTGTKRIPG